MLGGGRPDESSPGKVSPLYGAQVAPDLNKKRADLRVRPDNFHLRDWGWGLGGGLAPLAPFPKIPNPSLS
jgi:hypothetical protein